MLHYTCTFSDAENPKHEFSLQDGVSTNMEAWQENNTTAESQNLLIQITEKHVSRAYESVLDEDIWMHGLRREQRKSV